MSGSSALPSPCGAQQSLRAAPTLLIRQTCLAALHDGGRHAWRRDTQTVNLLKSHLDEDLLPYGGGGEKNLVSVPLITQEAEKFYPVDRHGDQSPDLEIRKVLRPQSQSAAQVSDLISYNTET